MARGSGNGEDAARRVEESLRSIEAGGLPLAARERLAEVGRRGDRFFTSNLSVPEFLIARQAGFRPITQVMGSCFYQTGWQGAPAYAYQGWQGVGQTFELETQTEAWNEARSRAIGRLREEARLAGADAVIGVRIERGSYDWARGLIEIIATGTAVRSERYELGDEPVLSNLTGQEFGALFAHGWWPAGIVAATTVCYVVTGYQQQARSQGLLQSRRNQELPDYTQGVYDARTQALLRVQRQGHESGAHGLVGVAIETEIRETEANEQRNLVVTLHILGTAVVELASDSDPPPVYIALALD